MESLKDSTTEQEMTPQIPPSSPSTKSASSGDMIISEDTYISSPVSPNVIKMSKQATDRIINENHENNRDGGISPTSCFSTRIYFPNPHNVHNATQRDTRQSNNYPQISSPPPNSVNDQAFLALSTSSSIKKEEDSVSLGFAEDSVLSRTCSPSASPVVLPFHRHSDLSSVVQPHYHHQQRYHQQQQQQQPHSQERFDNENYRSDNDTATVVLPFHRHSDLSSVVQPHYHHQQRYHQQQQQQQPHSQQRFDNENYRSGNDNAPCNHLEPRENTPEQREREEEESIALARLLMAEEAEASHRMSANLLRQNADQFSQEDYEALQAALAEEEEVVLDEGDALEDDEDLSYETLLRLGERIGDVKTDRWAMVARKEIDKLEVLKYDVDKAVNKNDDNDSEIKCLVCQFPYEQDDELRRLPCGHCFHLNCVDQWLMEKDFCPYCRQTICKECNN